MTTTKTEILPDSLGQRALAALADTISLGDKRLDKRAVRMARQSLSGRTATVASLFGETENSSHFLSKADVELMALRQALYKVSWNEVIHRQQEHVVAIFDPSFLIFQGHKKKKDLLTNLGDGRGRGYVWLNLGLADPETGSFLGVAHQTLVSARGPDDGAEISYVADVAAERKEELRHEFEHSYKNQFIVHAREALKSVPPGVEVTLVSDREFDDGLVLREITQGYVYANYVIRSNASRKVFIHKTEWLPEAEPLAANDTNTRKRLVPGFAPSDDLKYVSTDVLVEKIPLTFFRELPLDARGRACSFGDHARLAQLGVGVIPICLGTKSVRARSAGISEQPVWINLVVVREMEPPPPGTEEIRWALFTDRRVESMAQLTTVVDCYLARWRIEEFFRTTKDVLALEDSRLDDPEALARLLFFVTFRAMCLDTLRFEAGLEAGVPPSDEQRAALRAGASRVDEIERMTSSEKRKALRVLSASQLALMILGKVAQLGRWSGKRGRHLGNYVLVKGLDLFLHDISTGHYRWLLQERRE